MQLDKNALNKLANMNDNELKNKITQIALACGADMKKIERQLYDMDKIKQSLKNANEKDLEMAIRAVGKENAQIIADSLKNLK